MPRGYRAAFAWFPGIECGAYLVGKLRTNVGECASVGDRSHGVVMPPELSL